MYFSYLLKYLFNNSVKFILNVKTADLVSFKIGGKAKIAVFPKNINEFIDILTILNDTKFVIIGNGTNCYFTDDYFDHPIVSTRLLNKAYVDKNVVTAECGCTINSICKIALKSELSGLEFAYGIPGSIGGGVYMNASAFGDSFSSVILSSKVYDKKSKATYTITKEEHRFDTKHSIFKDGNLYVLESTFGLNDGKCNEINQLMLKNMNKRINTQPLDMPSAGSVFIKPDGPSASALIDSLGLKGYSVGDAQVSKKHAGFIVNNGNAKATEVNELISHIKHLVNEKYNIALKEEIIYIN
ncbi:MAG: UDP-N-acetylmuramate dehydrogenase [Clostridia bacterium]|nr:UDP-N-acetylmuramate dehydrogenase [Clostridia bacterium]